MKGSTIESSGDYRATTPLVPPFSAVRRCKQRVSRKCWTSRQVPPSPRSLTGY